ncbi:M48 family metallopeptidase [Luteococcus peritonei]|uniref:M48 family metallopeptidase n=1 Tax=Luteococcus peritonei TaxID=88874 RepID=A0ABW4RXG7_9ACTN
MSSSTPVEIEVDGVRVVARTSARRRKTIQARRERNVVVVHLPERMAVADQRRWLETMGRRVLAREQRSRAPRADQMLQRAEKLAAAHLDRAAGRPLRPTEVKWVTNQNRRWASCSTETGVIRLSHRLQPFPDWVVDYVLVHELAHLAHRHHDAAFHALVAHYPLADKAEGFLQGWVHGRQETAPGPADMPQGLEGDDLD